MTRVCTRCLVEQPLDDFGRNPKCKDGRKSRCKKCLVAISRAYRIAHPGSQAAYKRKARYGLTPLDYDNLLASQGGKCAMCDAPFENMDRPVVDHDHKTLAIRGIIHSSCNLALGHVGESVDRLAAAIRYLSR